VFGLVKPPEISLEQTYKNNVAIIPGYANHNHGLAHRRECDSRRN
jgi:hypothetical protein